MDATVVLINDEYVYVHIDGRPLPLAADTSALAGAGSPSAQLRNWQHVRGYRLGDDGFEIAPDWVAAADALREYQPGACVIARVAETDADAVTAMLYPAVGGAPAVNVAVKREDLIDDDVDLRPVFSGLKTVALRVTERDGDEPDRLDEFDNRIDRTDVQDKYRLHYTRDGAERVLFKSVNIHDDLLR